MSARIAPATAAIAVLILLITAACDDDEAQPAPTATINTPMSLATRTPGATPTPSATRASAATPTPTATMAPEVIDGVEVLPLQFGEEAELPDDVALIVEATCQPCDGPSSGLYLVYRDASGQVRMDDLFGETLDLLPPAMSTPAAIGPIGPYIHSLTLNNDASDMVVDVCTHGRCVWIDETSPDAQSTLYRSNDGGVTWEEFGVLDGSYYVQALAKKGLLLNSPYQPENGWNPKYELFPSGEPVEPPPGASRGPLALPGGELAWPTDDGRLLRDDGSQILTLGQGGWVQHIVPDASGQRLAVASIKRLGVFSLDGRPITAFSSSYAPELAGWLSDTLVVGSIGAPGELLPTPGPGPVIVPAIFDLEAGEAHPILHPFLDQPRRFSYIVRAVLHGPFARVVNTGGCLDVRQEPSAAAAVLACAADGVLLRDTGETREADGATWARVVTPAGVGGWASDEYLER
jgi:hypothetical protein